MPVLMNDFVLKVALMCEMVPTSKKQVACLCLVENSLLSSGSSTKLKAIGMYGK